MRALIDDHFLEAHNQINGIQVFELHDISVVTFAAIVSYIYQNSIDVLICSSQAISYHSFGFQFDSPLLEELDIYELLLASDLYLLGGLKRLCANYIGHNLTSNNVISILLTARLMQLTKLESSCAEFIAQNLEKVTQKEEFRDLIVKDAKVSVNTCISDSVIGIDVFIGSA